jgi:predicted transcriptional regulator
VSHVIAYGMHAESADPSSSGIHTGVSDASRMYSDVMKRTTIVAPEELLDRLHVIAREENTSLADIIRQALEWRASQARTFQFIAASESSEPPHDTGRRAGDITFSPRSWR